MKHSNQNNAIPYNLEAPLKFDSDTPDSIYEDDYYILVVDDNPFNIMLLENFANECGYAVESAMNGETAI